MVVICGIDEAGRGPVIGPMVIAGVLLDEKDIKKLRKIGVKDSKLLSRERREALFEMVKRIVNAYEFIIVSPREIDMAVESKQMNLNLLEAHKTAEIINKLKPDKAIVDSPSVNHKSYSDYLKRLIVNKDIKLECTHKADVRYPHVAAASIIAKVIRDREIDNMKEKYGDCGPGYMSNPITKDFLERNWKKYPEIFRHSWISYKNQKNKTFQRNLSDF